MWYHFLNLRFHFTWFFNIKKKIRVYIKYNFYFCYTLHIIIILCTFVLRSLFHDSSSQSKENKMKNIYKLLAVSFKCFVWTIACILPFVQHTVWPNRKLSKILVKWVTSNFVIDIKQIYALRYKENLCALENVMTGLSFYFF